MSIPLSSAEQWALSNEIAYTRQEFAAWIARTPWWENKPIMCQACNLYRDMVHPARMQYRGVWLCLNHLLERGVRCV
jgi:hypothetical protein